MTSESTPSLIPADMAVSSKFAAFNLIDVAYKEVNGTPIPATILIPKAIKPGKHPIHVRWHGGSFFTGHRMYPDWFGSWKLEHALREDAILISPDYRLLPEANALDILDDVRDFFAWLAGSGNLSSLLPEGVEADVHNVLVSGESAGGWLALQSALLPASRPSIRAVIPHYPMIDMRDKHYTQDYEKQLFTPTAPQLDRSVLRNYLAGRKAGDVVTSGTPPDRVPLVISAMQQGAFATLFGEGSVLYPIEASEETLRDLPPLWVLHGTEDTVIPVDGTYKFEGLMKEKAPDARTLFYYDEGTDHGFDNGPSITLETAWVKEGLDFVGQYWPRQ